MQIEQDRGEWVDPVEEAVGVKLPERTAGMGMGMGMRMGAQQGKRGEGFDMRWLEKMMLSGQGVAGLPNEGAKREFNKLLLNEVRPFFLFFLSSIWFDCSLPNNQTKPQKIPTERRLDSRPLPQRFSPVRFPQCETSPRVRPERTHRKELVDAVSPE